MLPRVLYPFLHLRYSEHPFCRHAKKNMMTERIKIVDTVQIRAKAIVVTAVKATALVLAKIVAVNFRTPARKCLQESFV